MDQIIAFFTNIPDYLGFTLFYIGETEVTLWTLVYLTVLILTFLYLVERFHHWLVYKAPARTNMSLEPHIDPTARLFDQQTQF